MKFPLNPSNLEDTLKRFLADVDDYMEFAGSVFNPKADAHDNILEAIESTKQQIESQYIPREAVLKALEDVKKVYRLDSPTFDVNLSRHLAYIVNSKLHEIKKELGL